MGRVLVVVFALLAATGCASYSFDTYITVPKDRPPAPTPAPEADDVKVYVEQLPEGVTIADGELVVDPAKYDYRGKVNVVRNKPLLANFGFWPYEFKDVEGWRYALCVPQVPLAWFTLSIWAWLSPTYWPCHVSEGTEDERRETMTETMKQGTKLAGGDVLVIGGFGGYDFVTVSKNPNGMKQSGRGSIAGVGYALKTRR
jgi:hypothetical protein